MNEFELIEHYFKPLSRARADIVRGIGDDAAVVRVPPGEDLVISTDTQIEAVHFPANADPRSIARRSYATSVSDLAAMGAAPRWATLSLSLPGVEPAWLGGFASGIAQALDGTQAMLIGGDTTRGACSITWTVMGTVASGAAIGRDGAGVDDSIYVSGSLGAAAAAVRLFDVPESDRTAPERELIERFWGVQARLSLGLRLAGLASSCVDVSDGLVADLGHVTRSSHCGAEIELAALPVSQAAVSRFGAHEAARFAAFGGDDYELCFTVAKQHEAAVEALRAELGLRLTRIGKMIAGSDVVVTDPRGAPVAESGGGYRHFA